MALSQYSLKKIVKDAIGDSGMAEIKFENAGRYNHELEHTFERTVRDVSLIGDRLRILEVGTFTGVVSISLSRLGHAVTASDMPFVVGDSGLKGLLGKCNVRVISADLSESRFPAPDGSFDLIVFNEVLEHLNFNPIPLLREFSRILVSNGRVYCATPNLVSAKNRWLLLRGFSYINPIQHLLWNLEPNTGMSVGLHWREWSKAELINLFRVSGFVLESHRFGLCTPNRSGLLRRSLVNLMYCAVPSLMPNQVGTFKRLGIDERG